MKEEYTTDNTVAIDFETYYDKKTYSISDMTPYTYCHHPEFDPYLVSVYGMINGKEFSYVGHPDNFDWRQINGLTWLMHNAPFDNTIIETLKEQGRIPESVEPLIIRDTADLAAYLGSMRALAKFVKVVTGKTLSKKVRSDMSGKHFEDLNEEEQTATLDYALSDAVETYGVYDKCQHMWPEDEKRLAYENFKSHNSGVDTDIAYMDNCIASMERERAELLAKLPWVAEGEKPLSPKALKAEAEKCGIKVPSSRAKTNFDWNLVIAQHGDKYPWLKAVGVFRSLNTHLNKAKAVRENLCADGKYRMAIKYFGAATGRFSGGTDKDEDIGGKFNPQNMPRAAMFGCDLRKFFHAGPGYKFILADYSQVEARLLLWLAGDTTLVEMIRREGNLYQAYAKLRGYFNGEGEFKKQDPMGYANVKSQVLGLGYRLSGNTYTMTLVNSKDPVTGLTLVEEELAQGMQEYKDGQIKDPLLYVRAKAFEDVKAYRTANPLVVKHWKEHEYYLMKSVVAGDETHEIALRSGRVLRYYNPHMVESVSGTGRRFKSCKARQLVNGNENFLHSGLLTNNECQATARDMLKDSWLDLVDNGFTDIKWTIHDEFVIKVPEDKAEEAAPVIEDIMLAASPWVKGCPVGVETTITDVYTK